MAKKFEDKKKEIASKGNKREDATLAGNEKGAKDNKKFPSKNEKECATCGSKKHKTMDHKGYND